MALWGSSLWPTDMMGSGCHIGKIQKRVAALIPLKVALKDISETKPSCGKNFGIPSHQVAVEGKWSELRICMCLYPWHSDYIHGRTVLEELALEYKEHQG